MKTPDPNCRKMDALTFTIASMLPQIVYKILFNVWKIKEIPWNILFSFILMIFHTRSPKTD